MPYPSAYEAPPLDSAKRRALGTITSTLGSQEPALAKAGGSVGPPGQSHRVGLMAAH